MAHFKEDDVTKANDEAVAQAKEETVTKSKKRVTAKAKAGAAAKPVQAAPASAEQEAAASAEQDAAAKAEQDAAARAEEETAVASLADCLRIIAAETTDYSKMALENGSAFVENLRAVQSFETAIHIQSEFARTSYAHFLAYVTKIGALYCNLANAGFKRRCGIA